VVEERDSVERMPRSNEDDCDMLKLSRLDWCCCVPGIYLVVGVVEVGASLVLQKGKSMQI